MWYKYQYEHFLRKTTGRDQNWMLTALNFVRYIKKIEFSRMTMTDNNFFQEGERQREYPIRNHLN